MQYFSIALKIASNARIRSTATLLNEAVHYLKIWIEQRDRGQERQRDPRASSVSAITIRSSSVAGSAITTTHSEEPDF